VGAKKPESGNKRTGAALLPTALGATKTKETALDAKSAKSKAVTVSEYPDDFVETTASIPPDSEEGEFDSVSSSSAPPLPKKTNGKVKEQLIRLGKTKGFLTYDDVHEALPGEDVGPDQMEDMLTALDDERIEVVDDVSELKLRNRHSNDEELGIGRRR